MTRRIGVVTSSRADYGHLYWPLVALRDAPDVELQLYVTGAHLSSEFGRAADVIERDGFEITERVECLVASDSRGAMGRGIGLATLGFTDVLERHAPDLLVIIADRFEMLGPANAALALRIPIVHIEGGEASEGAIDHAIRNALTMMAHVHLVPTELAGRRVRAMGEESWRVHRTGAPSLDHLRRSPLLSREALEADLGLSFEHPTLVVAYHPVTLESDLTSDVGAVLDALDRPGVQLIFCYPNADAGSRAIRSQIEAFCADRDHAHLLVNLDPVRYWSLLRCATAMVGNSSSGIMESPSLDLPAINIGARQAGRERATNIIDVPADRAALSAALDTVLSTDRPQGTVNPYGDGRAAERIVEALRSVEINDDLLRKRTWIPPADPDYSPS